MFKYTLCIFFALCSFAYSAMPKACEPIKPMLPPPVIIKIPVLPDTYCNEYRVLLVEQKVLEAKLHDTKVSVVYFEGLSKKEQEINKQLFDKNQSLAAYIQILIADITNRDDKINCLKNQLKHECNKNYLLMCVNIILFLLLLICLYVVYWYIHGEKKTIEEVSVPILPVKKLQ